MKSASLNSTLVSRLIGLAGAAALAGCAVAPSAPTVMVLPGVQKSPSQYQLDNAQCQQQAKAYVAPQVEAANNQAAASAVIGTAIGAAVGALFGSGYYYNHSAAAWGAGTGLLMGSSVGAGQSQASSYSLQQRYDIAFMQCMYQLGNQVPGQVAARRPAPAARALPAVPPANQPAPNYPPPNTPAPSFPPPNTPAPIGAAPA
jgi:uncharacterized protein YcfJ